MTVTWRLHGGYIADLEALALIRIVDLEQLGDEDAVRILRRAPAWR